MSSLLDAIINIANKQNRKLKDSTTISKNRINSVGEALETFVKDAFAGTFYIENELEKLRKYNEVFSWLGNQNHPPDIMIRNGDAIEVKKIQNANSDLALNSSYPKSNLRVNNPMITEDCRNCENWNEKYLIYCIGHTSNNFIKSIWFVYGNIYAAKQRIYQQIKSKIAQGITEIPNVEFAETRELGRVNKVDPLGITNLRIRGMWHIQNPRKVFYYLFPESINRNANNFELTAIIPTAKYKKFTKLSRCRLESHNSLIIKDIQVKDPNNPVNLIDSKLIYI